MTLSYRTELWNLFSRIPTASNLEEKALEGLELPHLSRNRNDKLPLWDPFDAERNK